MPQRYATADISLSAYLRVFLPPLLLSRSLFFSPQLVFATIYFSQQRTAASTASKGRSYPSPQTFFYPPPLLPASLKLLTRIQWREAAANRTAQSCVAIACSRITTRERGRARSAILIAVPSSAAHQAQHDQTLAWQVLRQRFQDEQGEK